MPATPQEQQLLAELQTLAFGQAVGSFGPAQALAMLAGFVKLRDRVDQLVAAVAEFGGIDAAPRLAALEELTSGLQDVVAGVTDRLDELDAWKVGVDARLDALEQAATPPPPAVI